MPRKLRVEYPGALYHAMSRGDRCENIFLDDVDRQDLVKTLAEGCQKAGWQVHAYCLLKRVHLNPVRAGILKGEERLLAYPWSSLPACLAAPEHRPHWVRVDRLLGEHGLQEDTAGSREEFERQMERRRLEETDPEALKVFRRGRCLGSREFKQQMWQNVEGRLGEHHSGELRCETAEAKAERIIAEELSRLGWSRAELAARLSLGTSKSANACLHQFMAPHSPPDPRQGELRI